MVVRRLKRQRDKRVKLPQTLVEELARTAILGQQAWQEAREKDDFPSFRPLLERMIELKRQQAEALGLSAVPLRRPARRIRAGGVDGQRRQGVGRAPRGVGPAGGEDPSERPPAGHVGAAPQVPGRRPGAVGPRGVGGDRVRFQPRAARRDRPSVLLDAWVRTTAASLPATTSSSSTRRFSAFCTSRATASTIRACRREHFGLPLGEFVSLGIHESQSRMWENLVGRSRAFWTYFYPKAQAVFPAALADVSLDAFHFAVNDVRPSLIRIEADEATYNLHILIRFELERALLDNQLEAADLPEAWNAAVSAVPGHHAAGQPPAACCRTSIGVPGLIGYFPTYSLGNLYAAQFFAKAEAELGNLPESFARGDFRPLLTVAARERPPPRPAVLGGGTGETGHRPAAVAAPVGGPSHRHIGGSVRSYNLLVAGRLCVSKTVAAERR